MQSDEKIEPFAISDTPLAAYLVYKGMELLSTVPDKYDRKRRVFVFVDIPQRPALVDEWTEADTEFHAFYRAMRTVQQALYNGVDSKPKKH